MNLLLLFLGLPLVIIGLTLAGNLLFFQRLRPQVPASRSFLSILIPARNEAAVIAATVQHVLAQTYPHFELILLDDNSSDGTGAVARAAAGGDERFQLLAGRSLPAGWLGKNWACHQLAAAAQGDLLLFLDADVQLAPAAVAGLVALQTGEGADLLTVWPTQITVSWGERLVVPLMALAILGYLPILPVHHTRWPLFAAANGQCLLFRRHAYDAVGGHAAVRDDVVEDVALARRVKAAGRRLRMADGAGLVRCRMYDGWPAVRDGFAKNILAGHGGSGLFLLLSTLFHWTVFVGPWLWLLAGGGVTALGLCLAGVTIRAASAAFTGQRLRDALLLPLSVVLMTVIAARALWQRRRGGVQWKGRVVA